MPKNKSKQEIVLTDYDNLDIDFVSGKGVLVASISFERIGQQLQFNLMHPDGNRYGNTGIQTGLVA